MSTDNIHDRIRAAFACVEPPVVSTADLARRIEKRRADLAKERDANRRLVRAIFLREDEDEMIRRVEQMGGAA